jgi:signal transduction histidine kinase
MLGLIGLLLGLLLSPSPAAAQTPGQACDVCGKHVGNLDQPLKLAGTWLFTRDDRPENAMPGTSTAGWKVVKAPGPWKKVYDDGQIFEIGWYRGEFEFAPELVGKEVVLLANTYMASMRVYVNGREVYRRPHNGNVERYYSIQSAPVRFHVPQQKVTLTMRVDTPLMTGVYQLPFEMHRYDPADKSLIGWAVWGGELRVTIGWVALFFAMFFALVYAKTRYAYYLVAACATLFAFQFLITPADYLVALFPANTLLFLHYFGLYAAFFFFFFSQFFYKFTPRINWVAGTLMLVLALGVASTAVHGNLRVFHGMRSVMFPLLALLSVAAAYFCFRGALDRKPGAKTMMVGVAVFAAAGVNDMLLGLGLINSISTAATGLSVCLLAMLYVAINSFADTFVENKRLVGSLRDINENLENLVAERTQALREKTNDIQAMLQNMPQGVATVTADGRVHPEYSAYLETIYETRDVAGREVMNFLFGRAKLGADARDQVSVAIASTLGEDRMNYDFNSHLLVPEVEIETAGGSSKFLELSWSPICADDDTVEKLMVCVRDVTELKRLAAESAGQKRELELIGEILAVSQEKFQSFIESAHGFLVENRQTIEAQTGRDLEAVNLLFRNMHTIKGNARTYGLLHLTNVVHEAEQAYDLLRKDAEAVWDGAALLAQLDAVESMVDEYAKINDHTLGRKGPGRRGSVEKFLMVDRVQLAASLNQLQQVDANSLDSLRAAVKDAERTLRLVGTESFQEALSGLVEGLPSLARELGKESPRFVIDDGGLRLKSQLSGLLRNLFSHLLRNALDHGLEPGAERQSIGKAAEGLIELRAASDGQHLQLRLRDDGRGLALAKIRERALERGLIAADSLLSDAQVAELIFEPGFSTAEAVTEVSGRGVGMDAVRDFLRREGGSIAVRLDGGAEGDRFRHAELVIQLPAAAAVSA